MPLADFEDLCTSLCDLVGVEPPRLVPDAYGNLAFTITMDGVDVGFVKDELGGEPGAIMITSFGVPDASMELQVLRRVLDANFMVSAIGSAMFVRNPLTGEIVLHRPLLLARMNAQDAYKSVMKSLEALDEWQAGKFFGAPEKESFSGRGFGGEVVALRQRDQQEIIR